jgi:hypothetical protein
MRWLVGRLGIVLLVCAFEPTFTWAAGSEVTTLALCQENFGGQASVSLVIDRRSTHPGGVVRIKIVNESHSDISYGLTYGLLRFTKGAWVVIPTPPQFGPRFVLRSGEAGAWQAIHLSKGQDVGRYQVRKIIQVAGRKRIVTATFRVGH